MDRRRCGLVFAFLLLAAASPAFAGQGAGGFFFGFFDFVWVAFEQVRNWLSQAVDYIEATVVAVFGEGWAWLDLAFESVLFVFTFGLSAVIQTMTSLGDAVTGAPSEVLQWVVDKIDLVFAAMLEGLDEFVPAEWSLASTAPGYISGIVGLANYLGVFVDYGFILSAAGATGVIVANIEIFKIIWRCIPGVG